MPLEFAPRLQSSVGYGRNAAENAVCCRAPDLEVAFLFHLQLHSCMSYLLVTWPLAHMLSMDKSLVIGIVSQTAISAIQL